MTKENLIPEAVASYKRYRRAGASHEDALAAAAEQYGLQPEDIRQPPSPYRGRTIAEA